ncbi:hypothetical protein HN011_002842 [Eciton burchellii]|nr:hypothetical protein HN011_002842 [Eciton burchellii]
MRVETRASPAEGRSEETTSAKPSVKLARVYETLPLPNLTRHCHFWEKTEPDPHRSRKVRGNGSRIVCESRSMMSEGSDYPSVRQNDLRNYCLQESLPSARRSLNAPRYREIKKITGRESSHCHSIARLCDRSWSIALESPGLTLRLHQESHADRHRN